MEKGAFPIVRGGRRMFTRLPPYFQPDTHLIKHEENNYLVVKPRPFEVAA
jgi:hypothetical protein